MSDITNWENNHTKFFYENIIIMLHILSYNIRFAITERKIEYETT